MDSMLLEDGDESWLDSLDDHDAESDEEELSDEGAPLLTPRGGWALAEACAPAPASAGACQ